MRLHQIAALCAAVLLPAVAAHADTLTFNLGGTGNGNVPDSGTFVVDTTTDLITSATFNSDGFILTDLSDQGVSDGGYSFFLSGALVTLFPRDGNDDPASFTTGDFRQLGPNDAYSGTFTLTSTTPEPTPLLLLATGLLLPIALRRHIA